MAKTKKTEVAEVAIETTEAVENDVQQTADDGANPETKQTVKEYLQTVKDGMKSMKMEELFGTAERLCMIFNEARISDAPYAVTSEIESVLKDVMKEYVTDCRVKCFAELKKAEDPIIEACKRLTYDTHRVVDSPMEQDGLPVMRLEPTVRQIDLLKLHKAMDKISGKNPNWVYMLEALNKKLTARVIIGVNPEGDTLKKKLDLLDTSYKMGEIKKEFLAGKTPTSNTQVQKELQALVTAMIGEGKVLTHDTKYLVEAYMKLDPKTLGLKASNHKTLATIIKMVIHRIVCNDSYAVIYDQKKAK